MTQEQLIKLKERITEFVDQHKEELALIKKDLTKVMREVTEEVTNKDEVQE